MHIESAIAPIRVSRIAARRKLSLYRASGLKVRFHLETVEVQLDMFRCGRSIPVQRNQAPLARKQREAREGLLAIGRGNLHLANAAELSAVILHLGDDLALGAR